MMPLTSYLLCGFFVSCITLFICFAETYLDDTQAEFDAGTYSQTQWDAGNNWLELQAAQTSGNYVSAIIDAGLSSSWDSLGWSPQQPFYKELPDSGTSESGYGAGNFDMSNIVALYHLNENSTTIIDSSGNGYNGTKYGATYTTGGKLNGAYDFDGTNDYVLLPDDMVDVSSDFTVSMWMNADSDTQNPRAVSLYESNGDDFEGGWMYTTNKIYFRSLGAVEETSSYTIPFTEFHNVVWVYRSGVREIWVDGVQRTLVEGGIGADSTFSSIGAGYDTASYTMNGIVDEVAIWSDSLSQTEIIDLYRRGANRLKYQVRSCDDNLCDTEEFIGPDGTTSTYYSELANTGSIEPSIGLTNVSDNRYFQYKTFFESDSASYSPELTDVAVGYSKLNVAPTASSVSASQSTDGSGDVQITAIFDDANDDNLSFKVEYDTGSGYLPATLSEIADDITATYGTPVVDNAETYQIGTASGYVVTTSGANTVSFVWNSKTDEVGADTDSATIRITPNDGTVDGSGAVSDAFTVDNVAPTLLLSFSATSEAAIETVSGTTEANSLIYKDSVYVSSADGAGDFSFVMGLQGGTNAATVYSVDAFGNVSASQSVVIIKPGSSGGGNVTYFVPENDPEETGYEEIDVENFEDLEEEEEVLEEPVEDVFDGETEEMEETEETEDESESMSGEEEFDDVLEEEAEEVLEEVVEVIIEDSVQENVPELLIESEVEPKIELPVLTDASYHSSYNAVLYAQNVQREDRIKIYFESGYKEGFFDIDLFDMRKMFGKIHNSGIPVAVIKRYFGKLENFDYNADSDGDGLTDGQELLYGADPFFNDTDGDDVSDKDEILMGADPSDWDSDGDWISDGEDENMFEYDALNPKRKNGVLYGDYSVYELGLIDTDGDGLSDYEELSLGTDPRKLDSDGDGMDDGIELMFFDTNPKVAYQNLRLAFGNVKEDDEFYEGVQFITGHAKPYSNIEIYAYEGGGSARKIASAVTDATGRFGVLTDKLEAGDYTLVLHSIADDEVNDVAYPVNIKVISMSFAEEQQVKRLNDKVFFGDSIVVANLKNVLISNVYSEPKKTTMLLIGFSPLPTSVALINEKEEKKSAKIGGYLMTSESSYSVLETLADSANGNISIISTWQGLVFAINKGFGISTLDDQRFYAFVFPDSSDGDKSYVILYSVDRKSGKKGSPVKVELLKEDFYN
ncbi:hypothetical protein KKC94_03565 [Patescibacteria group bacterium]|nr:hypothetical protein [Patescibacteria group bacterium]